MDSVGETKLKFAILYCSLRVRQEFHRVRMHIGVAEVGIVVTNIVTIKNAL